MLDGLVAYKLFQAFASASRWTLWGVSCSVFDFVRYLIIYPSQWSFSRFCLSVSWGREAVSSPCTDYGRIGTIVAYSNVDDDRFTDYGFGGGEISGVKQDRVSHQCRLARCSPGGNDLYRLDFSPCWPMVPALHCGWRERWVAPCKRYTEALSSGRHGRVQGDGPVVAAMRLWPVRDHTNSTKVADDGTYDMVITTMESR